MRHLRTVSYAMTIGGVALVAATVAFDLNPTLMLAGLLLIVAGVVKIGMVALWHNVAGFGMSVANDDRQPAQQTPPATGSRRRR